MLRILALLFFVFPASAALAEEASSGGGSILSVIGTALNTVVNYIKHVVDAVPKAIDWCLDLAKECFVAIWDVLQDGVMWVMETLLTFAASLIGGLADSFKVTELASRFSSLWSGIPPEVLQVFQAIGISSALGIVVLGIIIRFSLQLIPFVRLGS